MSALSAFGVLKDERHHHDECCGDRGDGRDGDQVLAHVRVIREHMVLGRKATFAT